MFGLLKCDCYIGDIVILWIVKSGFCSIDFTVILAGLKNVKRYIWDIVIPWIVKSGFCSIHFTVILPGLKNVKRYIGDIVISGFHCICKNVKEIDILTTAAKLRFCLIFTESRS